MILIPDRSVHTVLMMRESDFIRWCRALYPLFSVLPPTARTGSSSILCVQSTDRLALIGKFLFRHMVQHDDCVKKTLEIEPGLSMRFLSEGPQKDAHSNISGPLFS